MARSFNPTLFWLQWMLGTAMIFAIAVALFNVFGLLSTAIILLGFWQGWLLRRWIAIWRWWVITLGFGIAGFGCVIMLTLWLPYYAPLFSLRSLVIGAVMGAMIGLGQALLLRRQISGAYWWVLISAAAVAFGGGWVIDLNVRQVFNLEVPYTSVISPIAQALLPNPAMIQSLCRYSEFSVSPPPNPLQSPNWLYDCRAVNVGIAFVSGLIGGAIKGGGMVWLMGKAEGRGMRGQGDAETQGS
ncbi:MAG: hypothetical protein ICV62_19160 [Cyanobacteria bacterium Co-bin13]|nr:hypothetical protein [Cyanobacteria bacterium Co-bin13]